MNIFSKGSKLFMSAALVAAVMTSCTENSMNGMGDEEPNEGSKIETPATYSFESRFDAGASSVSYTGQTVRQLLMNDLKTLISNAEGNANFYTEFMAIYNYDDASNLSTKTSVGNFTALEGDYSEIATGKNLSGSVTSEFANQTVIGYEQTADELIKEWAQKIQDNVDMGKTGTAIYVDETTGVDYKQMIDKVMSGAVSYSQGTAKYLVRALTEDNTQPKSEGAAYSVQEHVWDEAFGYFGAARDYYNFSDEELAGSDYFKDLNGDGKIDFTSEYNFFFAKYAGKRDKSSNDTYNFTNEIFDAFLTGRTAIHNQEDASVIEESARAAAEGWEKVIAGNIIHYINSTIKDEAASTAYSKHWSEMKGFLIALQYGAEFSIIQDSQLEIIQAKVGNQPEMNVDNVAAYKASLEEVRASLQEIYGFDANVVANW